MSDFGFHTTGKEVVDRYGEHAKGKIILVTGGSEKGLGAGAAVALAAAQPAHIILTARTESKVTPVLEQIKKASPSTKTSFIGVQLDDYDSVRSAAASINALVSHIDILINNAGIMAQPYSANKLGHESQLATNHLGHFLLTNLILSKVLASPSPRIVNLTSSGHRIGPFRFDDYNFSGGKTYDQWAGYGQAKTANVLFAVELAKRYGDKGLKAFSVHPGGIWTTSLGTHLTEDDFGDKINQASLKYSGQPFAVDEQKNVEEGVSTTLVAALRPDLPNGAFLEDAQVGEARAYATDGANAERLWTLSNELLGEKF